MSDDIPVAVWNEDGSVNTFMINEVVAKAHGLADGGWLDSSSQKFWQVMKEDAEAKVAEYELERACLQGLLDA